MNSNNQHSLEREAHSQDFNRVPSSPSPKGTATDDRDADAHVAQAADATFPQKLMDALERETTLAVGTLTDAGDRVFEWLSGGDGFVIRDAANCEREVLSKYFNKCKFMSFTRKLYRWGFRQGSKSTQGIKIFHHKHFVRGDRKRCLKMRSLVKSQLRPQPQLQHRLEYGDPAMFGPVNSHSQYGMTMGQNNRVMGSNATLATIHRPFPPQVPPPLLQMGGGGNIVPQVPPSCVQLGGRGDMIDPSTVLNLVAGRVPAAHHVRGSAGMPSVEMLAARLQLERLEQGRQQLMNRLCTPSASLERLETNRQQLAELLHGSLASAPGLPRPAPRPAAEIPAATARYGAPSYEPREQSRQQLADLLRRPHAMAPAGVAAAAAGYGAPRFERTHASEAELASEMLRQGSAGIAPWQALQLAEYFQRR